MKTKTIKSVVIAIAALAVALCFGLAAAFTARADGTVQQNYTVVTDEGTFKGIGLTAPQEGGLYIGVKSDTELPSGYNYAVTEFVLGENHIYDAANGGLLVHINTEGRTRAFTTRVLVFRTNTSGNRFYSTGNSTHKDAFINDDGTVGEVQVNKDAATGTVPAGVSGTWNLTWASMLDNSQGAFADEGTQLRVLILTDVAAETGVKGEGVSISSIATYSKDGDTVSVVEGVRAAELNYSYEAATAGEVNFADVTKGTKVNNTKKWHTAISVRNYVADAGTTAPHIEYGRTVKTEFVDGAGKAVAPAKYAGIKNITDNDGAVSYDFLGEVTPPIVAGYNYVRTDNASVLTDYTVKFVYEKDFTPQLIVHHVNTKGVTVKADTLGEVEKQGEAFTYAITTESIGDYNFIKADKELTGSITEDTEITLTYGLYYGDYTDYDVVNNVDDSFAGISLKSSMDGAFRFGIKDGTELFDGFTHAVTEFKLDKTIHDYENGGLLIQFGTMGEVDFNTKVVVFLNNGNSDFYSVVTGIPSSRTDTLILSDGTVGSIAVTKSSTSYNAAVPADTVGTWNIRWKDVLNNTHGKIDEVESPVMRVLIWTDLTRVSASENVGNGVSIGTIATYSTAGGVTTVVPGISTTTLKYSYDVDDETADVNLTDITKGTKIYNRYKWITAISIKNYLLDETGETVKCIDYARSSEKQVPVHYVSDKGVTLKADGLAKVMLAENGYSYSVTVPEFFGYNYASANRELKGTVTESEIDGLSVTLTYEREKHTVTLVYKDTDGNEIKESRVVNSEYGEYLELTADEIAGYNFVKSSRSLNITVMNDYTVILTYEKVSKGCKGSAEGAAALCVFAAAAVCLLALKKKKHGI